MAFVGVSLSVGTAIGLGTGTAAIIGGGALIGAGVGGLYSAVTGDGDILNSMLTGGLLGGAGAFGLNAFGVGAGTTAGTTAAGGVAGATGAGTIGPSATAVNTITAAEKAAEAAALLDAAAVAEGGTTAGMAQQYAAQEAAKNAALTNTASSLTPKEMLGYGLAGTAGLSLLGGRQKGPGAGQMPDPGMIRPYEYSSTPNEPTGIYPSPYATAEYNEAGNPILDTRERNYFSQGFSPMEPYSAKTGTVNPNLQPITMAARGGLMFDDESGMDEARGLAQGNLQKGLFGMGYAEGGEVDLDQERNKLIMKNIKSASTKDLEKIMGAMNQQEFLMKNMPNYAQAMSPTISGMVEGAQYGDRMTRAYEDIAKKRAMEMGEKFVPQENYARIQPTMVNPQSGTYGGIASIGRQIDPNTRVNAMANIQRTPYDRNAMESVRRLGVGVDRQLGRDTNLSAFYEQDPMGRDKMGGARLTQRFEEGGPVKHMLGGGLTAMMDSLMAQNPQMFLPKYEYDNTTQRYSTVNQPQQSGLPTYRFDPATREYQALAAGGHLGGYSDGGRMLKGPGDGMSDDIPGVIGNKQPARLADGEFVVPADVVSHLGNGSTDAGAKRLYAMMDEVRRARTGNKKQGKKIKAEKYLPA
jgi:hypothetical protein